MWAKTHIQARARRQSTTRYSKMRSHAGATVIAAVGPVRRSVNLRLEPVKDGAYDWRADRIQLLLGPPYLVEIGISRADDENDRINDAREQQRIIDRQNGGR